MELPFELRTAIDAMAQEYKLSQLTAASAAITEKYKTHSGSGKALITNATEAFAYSAVRMPATYGAVHAALAYALENCVGKLATMLDVGAGTGAASWAAADLLEDLQSVSCLERDTLMSSLGERLMNAKTFLPRYEWKSFDITRGFGDGKADLVVASYILNELSPSERDKALLSLWNATEKLLIIVEPGTPAAFGQMRKHREVLLANGANIAAPCTHNEKCAICGDDWCHFTCRVARSKLHRQLKGGEAPYEDEKFSFLAVTREPCKMAAARVLRHPKIESGKITLQLCTAEGICEKIVTKKSGELFKTARKADCGDSFPL